MTRVAVERSGLHLAVRLVARSREDAVAMEAAQRRGDRPAIAALAHRMVGAAGAFGLERLASLARATHAAARGGDDAALAQAIAQLAAHASSLEVVADETRG